MITKKVLGILIAASILAACAPASQPASIAEQPGEPFKTIELPTLPGDKVLLDQDKTCRQTIQNLYSVNFYCPNNLKALKSLFTNSFNEKTSPSLDRCGYMSGYKILKLLSSNQTGYPVTPDTPDVKGPIKYYAEVEAEVFAGKSMPGNNPFSVWITLQMDKPGTCKINDINGGG